jgi:hypothetical protein
MEQLHGAQVARLQRELAQAQAQVQGLAVVAEPRRDVAAPADAPVDPSAALIPANQAPPGDPGLLPVHQCVPMTRAAVAILAGLSADSKDKERERNLLHRNVKNRLRKKVAKGEVERLGEVGDDRYGTDARRDHMCNDRGLAPPLRKGTIIYREQDVLEAMPTQTGKPGAATGAGMEVDTTVTDGDSGEEEEDDLVALGQ